MFWFSNSHVLDALFTDLTLNYPVGHNWKRQRRNYKSGSSKMYCNPKGVSLCVHAQKKVSKCLISPYPKRLQSP